MPLTKLVYWVTVTFTMTEWADQLHHDNEPAHSTAFVQAFFGKASHQPGLSASLLPRFGSLQLLVFPKAKIAVEREGICDGHTVHKLSQQRLTAIWLAPRKSDCSRMRSKVSSDWPPSYIKAMRPVLEIFKMDGTCQITLIFYWPIFCQLITGYWKQDGHLPNRLLVMK
jgi:hypothetical protein